MIPADNKWFARIAAAGVIANALIRIDPQYPTVSEQAREALLVARAELVAEEPDHKGGIVNPPIPGNAGTKRRKGRGRKR